MKIRIFTIVLALLCSTVYAQNTHPDIQSFNGCKSWEVPSTPNGLKPTQNWFSIAVSPGGEVYFTGCDHKTNSALYKIDRKTEEIVFLGDAKSASEAAGNWQPAETCEKFHMAPIFYKNRIYLASADYTAEDEGYLNRRGFHWYCYDRITGRMTDLSAKEPNGISGKQASIVAAVLDEKNGVIYAISTPACELYRYDIEAGKTVSLGKPPCVPNGCYMPGRYLWLGQNGRVYFTASCCERILFYDPKTGFGERMDWRLAVRNGKTLVSRTGAEDTRREFVYMVDEEGRIYRYDRQNDKFTILNKVACDDTRYKCGNGLKMRAFNVSRDGDTIYFINDEAERSALWEYGISSGETKRLCDLAEIDLTIGDGGFSFHAGNNSMGNDETMCFCSFGSGGTNPTPLIVTVVNMNELKEWLESNGNRTNPDQRAIGAICAKP